MIVREPFFFLAFGKFAQQPRALDPGEDSVT